MKYILITLSMFLLSGCASAFKTYGDYVDKSDPCLLIGKPANYERPRFCASRAKIITVTPVAKNSFIISK